MHLISEYTGISYYYYLVTLRRNWEAYVYLWSEIRDIWVLF